MILTFMYLVLVSQCIIVFLSYRVSFLPTTIRKIHRSNVGAFPLKICPSGFLDFTFEIVPLHHPRVFDDPDVPSIKSRNDFQSQIWDPGISNFGIEDNEIRLPIITSHFILILVVKILFLPHRKALSCFSHYIPEEDLTAASKGVYIRSTTLYTAKERSNFMLMLTYISVREKHPMIPEKCTEQGTNSYSQCFVNDPMRSWPDVKILNLSSMIVDLQLDESEEEFYFLLKIGVASTSSNWPFDFLDWVLVYLGTQVHSMDVTSDFKKRIWVIRQRRLPNDHSESLPKSSNILISTKRQDTVLSPTTLSSCFKRKVMLKAFWSLSSKLIANNKYVKEDITDFVC